MQAMSEKISKDKEILKKNQSEILGIKSSIEAECWWLTL
jgi:hypothetical protein